MRSVFLPTAAVVFLLMMPSLRAEEPPPLTLAECVRRALSQGFDLEIQRAGPELARERLVSAASQFEPRLTTTIGTSLAQGPGLATAGPRNDSLGATVGVTQFLPTGTQLSVSTALNRTGSNRPLGSFDPLYASDTVITIRQPLGQGRNRRLVGFARRAAEIGVANADRALTGQVLVTIAQTETAFYRLAGAREQLKVVRNSLELAERLLREARAREKAGVGTNLAVAQAEVGVATARSSVIQAEAEMQETEDALHTLTGRFEFNQPIGPLVLPPDEPIALPSEQALFTAAKAHHNGYLSSVANLELAELSVLSAHDALKPELSLDLAAGLDGSENDGPTAVRRSFDRERTHWSVGLTWSRPWGRNAEKAAYRSARISQRQQETQLQQSEQALLAQVRQTLRAAATSRRTLDLAVAAVGLAEQQYALETTRFAQGLSTSRTVLQAQSDLESARVGEVQARFSVRTSDAALRALTTESLSRYHVDVSGGS